MFQTDLYEKIDDVFLTNQSVTNNVLVRTLRFTVTKSRPLKRLALELRAGVRLFPTTRMNINDTDYPF